MATCSGLPAWDAAQVIALGLFVASPLQVESVRVEREEWLRKLLVKWKEETEKAG